ncbi:MAG: NADH-quinone oxidoreductase subunit N [Anaerolineales bacterium]|nr:NADH-quinone oxidoreductase subunit N [Anaerolineales bacterium]
MTQTDLIVVLPVLVLAGWALVLMLVDLFVPPGRKAITGWLTLVGPAGAALALTAWPAGGSLSAFHGMLTADGFAAFLHLIFLFSVVVAVLLALTYLPRAGLERGEFYVLLLLTASGMLLMAQAADLIVVFLALELLSIPLYVLAGLARPRLSSEESAMKYFLLGAFASGFFVYGVALTYGASGSTNLNAILAAAQSGLMANGQPAVPALLLAGAALILVGLGFKVAAVPFHMWTPDVYEGAPSVVTAFMAVGAKTGGFAALLRVFVTAFPGLAPQWAGLTAVLSALTMLVGNLAALRQGNIKRLLAYSSIAHAGYLLMALPAAGAPLTAQSDFAVGSALFYLMAYALTTLGAWAVVMAVERQAGQGLTLDDYAGLFARRPGLALAMALFMFSLTGLPPTAGFIAKFSLFRATVDAGYLWLAIVGVLTSLVSAYYYLRVVVLMFMRPGEAQALSRPSLNLAVGVTAAVTLLIGLIPGPFLELAQRSLLSLAR